MPFSTVSSPSPLAVIAVALLIPTATGFLTRTTTSTTPTQRHQLRDTSLDLFFKPRPDVRQDLEFDNLEPLTESQARRERLARDRDIQQRFETFGDSLWELRSEMEHLSTELLQAIHSGHDEETTRQKLRDAESRDPELAYKLALANVQLAQQKNQDTTEYEAAAQAARSCLPQFNLEGLWVGKYGRSYDLINITYVGDTLIAEKVTGDNNVPQGSLSFQADLNPLRSSNENQNLQPITLTSKAAQKWGTQQLPRYAGLGQVAEANYRNAQWIDGQLIIIGQDYFSFAWLPIEQQIFFGRPSPELALKMLRDVTRVATPFDDPPSLEDHVNVQKDFALRCLEKTHDREDEVEGVPVGCLYWHDDDEDGGGDAEECYFE